MLSSRLSTVAVNAQADSLGDLLDGGTLKLYTGPQPASADDPVTTQTLLATLTLGSPAFAPAVGGTILANAIAPDLDADADGLAEWYRLETSASVAVADGSVGTVDTNLIMQDPNIVQHAEVHLDAFAFTVPQSN